MPVLEKLKMYIHQRQVERVKTSNLEFVSEGHFDNLHNIGLIFNASHLIQRDIVIDFGTELRNNGKQVKILGYFDKKMEDASFPFDYFSSNDLNFAYIPRSAVITKFIRSPFDILINLDYSGVLAIHYICAASAALFKVGPPDLENTHYDLMIEMNGEPDLRKLIRDIRLTLKKLK
jgi:hypothetical protein